MIISKYIKKVVILSITVVLLLIGNMLSTDDVYAVTGTPSAPLVDITVPEKINLKPSQETMATVTNNGICDADIEVSFKAVSSWNLVQMNTDFSKMAADQNKLAVSINNQDLVTNSAKFTVLRMSSENLVFNSKTPIRKNAIVEQKVGDFVFTFVPNASNMLVDGNTFNNLIKELNSTTGNNLPFTKVAFVDEVAPQGVTLYDFSSKKDNGVVAWYDAVTTTLKFSTQRAGVKVLANANCNGMFSDCNNLTEINTSNLDISQVTNMAFMFSHCGSLRTLDISNWNTSQVTNMKDMFYFCSSLQTLDLSKWDTSKVTDMSRMFSKCRTLRTLDVSNWNTSQVTDMLGVFNGCGSLETLDVSNWNTSQVTNMMDMFSYCDSLETLDVSKWDTSKVTDMSCMFSECWSLQTLNVSKWDTSKVTDMSRIFNNCSLLQTLDVSNWNTSQVTNMSSMFSYCDSLQELDLNKWDTSKVTDMSHMFESVQIPNVFYISNWNTSQVTDMSYMFSNCQRLYYLSTRWDTSKVVDISGMFYNNSYLEAVGLNFDSTNLRYMDNLFYNCYMLRDIYVGPNFKWIGSTGYPPTPNPRYIDGADGYWYDKKGIAFKPEQIPSNANSHYYASPNLIPPY